jgi:hypothetical protein
MVAVVINISHRLQPRDESATISGQDLATLSKFSHILLRSTLLARFVDRLPRVWSQGMAVELWDCFRTLEIFHTSAILLWEHFSEPSRKAAMPHLKIFPANPVKDFNYVGIGKKYHLSTTKSPPGSIGLAT